MNFHPKNFIHNSTKFTLVFTLMLMIMATAVAASFTNEWGEYQDDQSNRGFVSDDVGHWTAESPTALSKSVGKDSYQPLILSFNTSDKYIITVSGNFLQVYDEDLNLKDELNTVGTTPPVVTTYNNSNYIIWTNTTTIFAYTFNGSSLIYYNNATTSTTSNSGIKCLDNEELCLYLNDTSDVCIWNITESTTACYTAGSSASSMMQYPALEDIDGDYEKELVATYGSNRTSIFVFDIADLALDTGFSGDGKLVIASPGGLPGRSCSNPLIHNIDGGGHLEIIVLCGGFENPYYASRLHVFRGDGTYFPNFPNGYGTSAHASEPTVRLSTLAVCDRTYYSQVICGWVGFSHNIGPQHDWINCWHEDGSLVENITTDWLDYTFNDRDDMGLVCADMDSEGSRDEIVTPRAIIDWEGNFLNYSNSLGIDTGYSVSLADVDGDSELEVLLGKTSKLWILFSDFENGPPELYNNITYGGYFGYYNPVCINTTITFQARDCAGYTECNYNNDALEDTERIVTNCGFDSAGNPNNDPDTYTDNGSYDATNPSFACYYNQTGSFNVRLYLQDEYNDADFTEYNTNKIPILVTNGIPGVTCNLPASYIEDPGDQAEESSFADDATDQAIEDTFGILFGTSAKMRLLAGLSIVIGIGMAGASIAGPIGFAGGALISAIMVTFLGLLPVWIFILFLITLLLLVVFTKFIIGGAPGGT